MSQWEKLLLKSLDGKETVAFLGRGNKLALLLKL
jgi:hypothetical protein